MLLFQFFSYTLHQPEIPLKLSQVDIGYDVKSHSKSFGLRADSDEQDGTDIVYIHYANDTLKCMCIVKVIQSSLTFSDSVRLSEPKKSETNLQTAVSSK